MDHLVFKSPKNNPVTSSLLVANTFNKEHRHVLDAIRNLAAENSATKFFYQTTYTSRGKEYPQFIMDRDGFSLLVMGFTGKEALSFKLSFIEAFNAMERQLKSVQIPNTFAEALQLAADQARQLELQAPKVQFADNILESQTSISVSNMAKLLNLGQNKLFTMMRNDKILMNGGNRHNVPYQRYIDSGYFEITERSWKSEKGDGITLVTKVTPKGQKYITNKYGK